MHGLKPKEVGLATFGQFTISGHAVDLGGDGIHVDGCEVSGLRFIVVGVIDLAKTFVDVVSAVLEDNS